MKFIFIRTLRLFLPFLLASVIGLFHAQAQTTPVPNAQLAAKQLSERVDALLKKMTLEEKIGQLVQYSVGYATGPNASNLRYEDLVARGQLGSMLDVVGAEAFDPVLCLRP